MTLRSPLLLRAASAVTLLFAAGHTWGGLTSWSPPGETEVLRAMASFQFDVAGLSRSYFDFYRGFGFVVSVYFLAQAILLWQLAAIAHSDARAAQPLIATFVVANAAAAVVAWNYIFLAPVVFSVLIATLLTFTFFLSALKKHPAASAT